jgi:hypothetical protein
VNNDVSKHILFDWFDNNLAVFCIATYATHVNNFQVNNCLKKNKEARKNTVLSFKNDLLFLNFTFTNLSLIQTNQQQKSK